DLAFPGFVFQVDAFTPRTILLGHLVNAYQPSIDLDRPSTGAWLKLSDRAGAIELMIADLTAGRGVVAASSTVLPFELGGAASPFLRSLALSAEVASDLRAPACVEPSQRDPRCISAIGNHPGFDSAGQTRDDTFIATSPQDGLPYVRTTRVVGL